MDSIISSYFLLTALHLVLLINSRKILSSIRESQNRKIFFPIGKEEKRIAFKIIILQSIYILSYVILHQTVYHLKNEFKFNQFFIIRLMQSVFFRATESSTVALIAYKTQIIRAQINCMRKNFYSTKLDFYYLTIIHVKNQVKNLNQLFSLAIFLIISNCIIKQIVGICLLAMNFKNSFLYIMPHFILIWILLMSLCYVCNTVPNSMYELNDSFKCYLVEESCALKNELNLRKLYDLNIFHLLCNERKDMCFTVYGLYRIRSSTILCIFSIIISYSVILIQTSY